MLSSERLINRANLTTRRALLPEHLLMLSQLWAWCTLNPSAPPSAPHKSTLKRHKHHGDTIYFQLKDFNALRNCFTLKLFFTQYWHIYSNTKTPGHIFVLLTNCSLFIRPVALSEFRFIEKEVIGLFTPGWVWAQRGMILTSRRRMLTKGSAEQIRFYCSTFDVL